MRKPFLKCRNDHSFILTFIKSLLSAMPCVRHWEFTKKNGIVSIPSISIHIYGNSLPTAIASFVIFVLCWLFCTDYSFRFEVPHLPSPTVRSCHIESFFNIQTQTTLISPLKTLFSLFSTLYAPVIVFVYLCIGVLANSVTFMLLSAAPSTEIGIY